VQVVKAEPSSEHLNVSPAESVNENVADAVVAVAVGFVGLAVIVGAGGFDAANATLTR